MRKQWMALALSAAVTLAGTSLMAQSGGAGTVNSGASGMSGGAAGSSGTLGGNTDGTNSISNQAHIDSGTSTDGTNAVGTGRASGTSVPDSTSGGMMTSAANNGAQSQQIEGQLVDLYSAAQQGTSLGGSSNALGSSSSAGSTAGSLSAGSAASGSGSSGESLRSSGTSAGTGSTVGSSGMTSGSSGSGASGSLVGGSGTSSGVMVSSTTIRSQLSAGIPAAVVSRGQTFVIVGDPRQLASYAGQTVRVSGHVASSNLLIPDRVEVRQAGGDYRAAAFTPPGSNSSVRTVQDR